jgi:hypothetical protein
VVKNINSLPTWPRYTNSKEEFLDIEGFYRMTVKRKLRKAHCEFLKDPEGFLEKVTSSSISSLLKPAWLFLASFFLHIFI